MERKFLTFLTILLLAGSSSAENNIIDSAKDFIDRGVEFVFDLIASFLGGEDEIVCNEPYMRFGDGCCLDANENFICDKDEKKENAGVPTTAPTTKVTTTSSSTTSTTTSTEAATTTSTPPAISCYTNLDCGEVIEERVCYKGDVYLQRTIPTCRNSGTSEAACVETQRFAGASMYSAPTPLERCEESCKDGVCI